MPARRWSAVKWCTGVSVEVAVHELAPGRSKHIMYSGVESLRLVGHLQAIQNLSGHQDGFEVVIGDYAASSKSTAPLDECTSVGQVVVKDFREVVHFQT